MANEYGDVHRGFLQAVSNLGCIKEELAIDILKRIFEKFDMEIDSATPFSVSLDQTLSMINEKLAPFDQKLCKVGFEENQETYVVFISGGEDPINRLNVGYTSAEIDFFRLLIKEIAENDIHYIRPIVALNITLLQQNKPIKKNRADQLIADWVDQGYFYRDDNVGLLCFGPKLVCEFSRYLRVHFDYCISECSICLTQTFRGSTCENCQKSFHQKCLNTYHSRLPVCPECKESWKASVK